jgi:hypothetical protein
VTDNASFFGIESRGESIIYQTHRGGPRLSSSVLEKMKYVAQRGREVAHAYLHVYVCVDRGGKVKGKYPN